MGNNEYEHVHDDLIVWPSNYVAHSLDGDIPYGDDVPHGDGMEYGNPIANNLYCLTLLGGNELHKTWSLRRLKLIQFLKHPLFIFLLFVIS